MSNVTEIKILKEEAERIIGYADKLNRLMKNKDFKDIILQKYFVDDASNLVKLREDENIDELIKKRIDHKLIGIGQLNQYFNAIRVEADMMVETLRESDEALGQLLEDGEY
jgi:Asp-tRNA(Asn)/Glu-tRNA(Gln) amidotransferase C subunit